MAVTLPHMVWLIGAADAALREHVLFGDDIAPPGEAWFAPAAERPISRSARVLMLRYENADGHEIDFCLPAPPILTGANVRDLRAAHSVEGAERRWGPIMALLGAYRRTAPADPVESTLESGGLVWRTRRQVHSSGLIARLMQRERTAAAEQAEAAFRQLGQIPQISPTEKVGDVRSNG